MNSHAIEVKKYTEDSTPEEIQAILERVYILEDQIIVLHELPIVSQFSIELIFAKISKLATQFEKCAYLVDISSSRLPNAESRRVINNQFKDTLSNVKHVAFVSGKNFIINTAAKVVMFQTNLDSFSINKTREEAISIIKKVLRE